MGVGVGTVLVSPCPCCCGGGGPLSVPDRCHTVKSQVSSSIGSHVCNDRKIDKYMKNLQFLLSVEHDCRTACCLPTALQQQVQEFQETAQSTTVQE